MVLRTLEVLGPVHGYGIARRIEETSKHRLTLNYGTLYPALIKLEQEGFIRSEWRASENNRRAKYYTITAAGRKQLARETREWQQTADLMAAFFALGRGGRGAPHDRAPSLDRARRGIIARADRLEPRRRRDARRAGRAPCHAHRRKPSSRDDAG